MAVREHFLWVERWRPKTIADCILPDRLKAPLQAMVAAGELSNLIFAGPSGTGKTTSALAMGHEIGADMMVINASDENGIDVLRNKIKSFASAVSFNGERKYVILDEADAITPPTQAAFRAFIEEFARNCGFIFTCNYPNKLINPLHSRCTVVSFAFKKEEQQELMTAFFTRVKEILRTESVTCDPKVLSQVIKKYYPDFRRTLNALQGAVVDGAVTLSVLGQASSETFKNLWTALSNKDFLLARKWIAQHGDDTDDTQVFRVIYEWLLENAKPSCLPSLIVVLADYQYKSAFVADRQLNLAAALIELMAELEVK